MVEHSKFAFWKNWSLYIPVIEHNDICPHNSKGKSKWFLSSFCWQMSSGGCWWLATKDQGIYQNNVGKCLQTETHQENLAAASTRQSLWPWKYSNKGFKGVQSWVCWSSLSALQDPGSRFVLHPAPFQTYGRQLLWHQSTKEIPELILQSTVQFPCLVLSAKLWKQRFTTNCKTAFSWTSSFQTDSLDSVQTTAQQTCLPSFHKYGITIWIRVMKCVW